GRELRDLEAAILRHDPALEPDRVSSGKRSRRRLARPTRKAVAFAGAASAAIALGTVLAITLGAARGGAAAQVRANSPPAVGGSGGGRRGHWGGRPADGARRRSRRSLGRDAESDRTADRSCLSPHHEDDRTGPGAHRPRDQPRGPLGRLAGIPAPRTPCRVE